jgi:hypothetical protein
MPRSSKSGEDAGKAYMEVRVPKNSSPGETFNVRTPDQQYMQVTVPSKARAGQKLMMAYDPVDPRDRRKAPPTGTNSSKSKSNSGGASSSRTGEESSSVRTLLEKRKRRNSAHVEGGARRN